MYLISQRQIKYPLVQQNIHGGGGGNGKGVTGRGKGEGERGKGKGRIAGPRLRCISTFWGFCFGIYIGFYIKHRFSAEPEDLVDDLLV